MVKATKNDRDFNRYGCSLYRNTARLSVCYRDTVIFLRGSGHGFMLTSDYNVTGTFEQKTIYFLSVYSDYNSRKGCKA